MGAADNSTRSLIPALTNAKTSYDVRGFAPDKLAASPATQTVPEDTARPASHTSGAVERDMEAGTLNQAKPSAEPGWLILWVAASQFLCSSVSSGAETASTGPCRCGR